MTMTMTRPELLREEDLVPGKAWVHPESRLEYEDFHAYFVGKDPLPHWRNARIAETNARKTFGGSVLLKTLEERRAAVVDHYFLCFDRDGNSFTGPRYLDTNSRGVGTLPRY